MPGSGIQLTGKLGEVIKESAQIALSFLKANAFSLGLTTDADHDLLYKRAIHLHMPYVSSFSALSPPTSPLTPLLFTSTQRRLDRQRGTFSRNCHPHRLRLALLEARTLIRPRCALLLIAFPLAR